MADPREPDHLPSQSDEAAKEGENRRRQLDEIPEHGTDPLHEGP